MKKTILLFCVLLMLTLVSLVMAGTPQIQKGATSIFYASRSMCVDDSWIGVQHFLANKTGVGAEFSFLYTNEDDGDKEPLESTDLGFDVFLIHYPFQKGSVALYVAPDIGLSLASEKDDDDNLDETTTSLWVGASLGAEWWISDQFSISASNWFGFETDMCKDKITDTKTSDTYLGILGSSSGSFIISFYFK